MGLSDWEVRQATARGMERHAAYLRGLDRLLTWLHVPHPRLS